jgi:hypothetical protein
MADIDLGAAYLIAFDVTDENNAPANATGVTLTVTLPDGTTATPTVTNPPLVTGKYRLTYLPASAGRYEWVAVTTVPNTSWADSFSVGTFRSILSLTEARDFLDLRDTSRDPVLRGTLSGLTRLIERYIGTCVPRTVTDEWVYGDTADMLRLANGPLLSATAVTSVTSIWAGGPTWATADLAADPAAGTVYTADGSGFTGGPWKATYTAGRQVITPDVTEGAKAALFDLWAPQRGMSADSIEPSMEEVTSYETAVPPGWRLPPRVMQMLDGERMPGFA